MTKATFKDYSRTFFSAAFLIISIITLSQVDFAQSSDPDHPSALIKGVINGSSSGSLSDEKTYYYAFNVKKGTLTLTLDITPLNKSDGGGYAAWTLLNTKFATLKTDVLTAHASPERQIKDMPVTIKRRIIMKIVVSGNMKYKFKLAGNAVNLAQ